jgi:hypothetical protein
MQALDQLPLLPHPRRIVPAAGRMAYHREVPPVPWTDPAIAVEVRMPVAGLSAQGYRLTITPQGVCLEGADPAGAFYGRMTLRQIARVCHEGLPCGVIEDWPDIPVRGVLLDISRDKVPTLATLCQLVEMLAEWKVNLITFNIEHTFAYFNHRDVWAAASPLTAEEVRSLVAFCRERHIEFMPFQSSFGHFERWLKHPRYRPLAECPDGFTAENGMWRAPTTLDPANPASLTLIAELYAELLPNFTSRRLHIGCDETWELGKGHSRAQVERHGKGAIYFDFLRKLKNLACEHGRTPLYFGDMVWNHFSKQLGLLDREMVQVDWGYYRLYPYREHGAKLAEAKIPFWFAPGTSTWCTLTGCNEAGLGSNRSAVQAGIEFGAGGILNTDWGDAGHWQTLPVSFIGFAGGAAIAWYEAGNPDGVIRATLDPHVFHDAAGVMGAAAYDFADAWMKTSENPTCAAYLHELLANGLACALPPNVTAATLVATEAHVLGAIERMCHARLVRPDGALIVEEFAHNARMAVAACRLGRMLREQDTSEHSRAAVAHELELVVSEHRRVWLARNRPGGLEDSLRVIETRLKECRQ